MLPLSSQVALHQFTTLAPEYARCPRCGALSPRNEIRCPMAVEGRSEVGR